MKDLLSRYHPRYVRSLVYMMQASEYRVRDFLRWFWRVRDFLHVEQRKELFMTSKSLLCLAVGYGFLFILYALAIAVLVWGIAWWQYPVFLLIILTSPFILVCVVSVFLIIVNFLQQPIEYVITRQVGQKLAGHRGLKIAIAGSFGKTSMREILKAVLGIGRKVAAPPESYNTPLGISRFVRTLKGDEDVLIFELGEYYPGDVRRLCRLIRPDIGVITGVNEAHLERFKDIERTRKTIFELADFLHEKPLSPCIASEKGGNGMNTGATFGVKVYINGENATARKYTRARDVLYSRAGTGDWRVEDAKTDLNGSSFILRSDSRTIRAHSALLGLHHVGPLAVAADVASRLGLPTGQIEDGIVKTKPFDHRLEPKTNAQGVTILDDSYNGNPDGVRAVIEFLSSLKGARRWYVTPGLVEMGKKKEEVHKEIGRELSRAGIEKVILIRNSVTPFIERGLQEGKYCGEVMWFSKALGAFAALPNFTVKGDVVLLQNDWPDQYA